jgi:hypothetical protein
MRRDLATDPAIATVGFDARQRSLSTHGRRNLRTIGSLDASLRYITTS